MYAVLALKAKCLYCQSSTKLSRKKLQRSKEIVSQKEQNNNVSIPEENKQKKKKQIQMIKAK